MKYRKRAGVLLVLALAPVLLSACGKSVASAPDDLTITTRVKTAFIADPAIAIARIDVETFKGVVTLSGRVRSKEEEQKAIAIARTIRGVVDVKSTLQIQP